MGSEKLFEHRRRPVQPGVDEAGEFVIDLDAQVVAIPGNHHDVVEDEVRDEMPMCVQDRQDLGHLAEQAEQHGAALQPSGGEQRSPAFGLHPFADAVPQTIRRSPDRVVAHEALSGKLFQFFQLALEARGDLGSHSRPRGKKADHHMLVRAFTNGPAEKRGIALMKRIDDAVIIDGLAPLAQVSAAGGTGSDFICDRLATSRTEFHNQVLRRQGCDAPGSRAQSLFLARPAILCQGVSKWVRPARAHKKEGQGSHDLCPFLGFQVCRCFLR